MFNHSFERRTKYWNWTLSATNWILFLFFQMPITHIKTEHSKMRKRKCNSKLIPNLKENPNKPERFEWKFVVLLLHRSFSSSAKLPINRIIQSHLEYITNEIPTEWVKMLMHQRKCSHPLIFDVEYANA